MYPSRKAMLEMIQLPQYAEISVHRTAGLAGQLNIETVALPPEQKVEEGMTSDCDSPMLDRDKDLM